MSTVASPVLSIEHLRLSYRARHGTVRAVDDVSLAVAPGEAVGLVGESGSGKSSLARAVLGLLPEGAAQIEGGRILIDGRDVTGAGPAEWERLRGHPFAIVFQDPLSYLNPVMRVGRQVAESVRRHDPRAPIEPRIRELLALVKLPAACAAAYPHELSGGMRQRALLAVALGCRPRLLIADEPTTALDVTTQAEILALLRELRERLGMAMLLISHDLGVVATTCARIYVMYAGRTVEWGETRDVFEHPAHPYSIGLLAAAQSARNARGRFATIDGDVPNLTAPVTGCPFAPRCGLVLDRCRAEMPPAFNTADGRGHCSRCWQAQREERGY